MSRSRLRKSQVDTGTRVEEICRKMGISHATFYNWKKKYDGLGMTEMRRLKQLEDENKRLKGLVADLLRDQGDVLRRWCEKSCKARHKT